MPTRAIFHDRARHRLRDLIADSPETYASLSRRLGRNVTYLQQFVTKGSPCRLKEDDLLALAQFFQVDERELGARDRWRPA